MQEYNENNRTKYSQKHIDSAEVIQQFWRRTHNKITDYKLVKHLSAYAKDFKAASLEDIRTEKYDQEIFQCINSCIVKRYNIYLIKQTENNHSFWRGLDGKNIDKNMPVKIYHGGGLFFIFDFLRNRTAGYRLEGNGGLGLQVSPNDDSKAFYYATRKPRQHFDIPTYFEAHVLAGDLTNATRNYEAGLRPESITKLTEYKITMLEKQSYRKL